MGNQVFNWRTRKGNVTIQKNGDRILLQLDYENGNYCLLTHTDAAEIIELLTNIAREVWEAPSYKKTPYAGRLYKITGNEYRWEIEQSTLITTYNDNEDGIEIRCTGNTKLDLEINYVIEIVQVLEHVKNNN